MADLLHAGGQLVTRYIEGRSINDSLRALGGHKTVPVLGILKNLEYSLTMTTVILLILSNLFMTAALVWAPQI